MLLEHCRFVFYAIRDKLATTNKRLRKKRRLATQKRPKISSTDLS